MLEQIRDVIYNASASAREAQEPQPNIWGDPPEYIKVNIKILQPKRALLARFLNWERYEKAILASFVEQRAALIDLLDATSHGERKISEIVTGDVANLFKWLAGKRGESADDLVRSAERKILEDRLQSDRQRADVAKAGLDKVEADIVLWTERVRILESREPEFVKAALIEAGAAAKGNYARAVREYEKALKCLWGMQHATAYVDAYTGVHLPDCGIGKIQGLDLLATPERLDRYAGPWRALGQAWLRDIRTDPGAYIERAKDL